MHIDWQQIITLAIVAVAAYAVGRRLWSQIAAFRAKPGAFGGGCAGCSSSGAAEPASGHHAAPTPLLQIQARPPAHLRRPPSQ